MHHDIRVIDRHSRFVLAMKDEKVVAQLASPVGQHISIGARRQTSKSNAMLAVENERAGSLQALALLLPMGEVDN